MKSRESKKSGVFWSAVERRMLVVWRVEYVLGEEARSRRDMSWIDPVESWNGGAARVEKNERNGADNEPP